MLTAAENPEEENRTIDLPSVFRSETYEGEEQESGEAGTDAKGGSLCVCEREPESKRSHRERVQCGLTCTIRGVHVCVDAGVGSGALRDIHTANSARIFSSL